jgi:ABC-type transport system substrate-binding protein
MLKHNLPAPRAWFAGLTAAAAMLGLLCGAARADTPLFEEEPYDVITLNSANDNRVLKIKPLYVGENDPDERPPFSGKLNVRLLYAPEKQYELQASIIVRYETFGHLVLAKANAIVADTSNDRRFDQAYDYFVYLQRRKTSASGQPMQMPVGYDDGIENFLYEEVKYEQNRKQFDSSLALCRELYHRNPKRPGIDQALGTVTSDLMEVYAKQNDYRAVRALLRDLARDFPDLATVVEWTERLQGQAAAALEAGRKAARAGKWGQAAEKCREMTAFWPQTDGGLEFAQTIHKKYPRVVVGVTTSAVNLLPGRLDDWAARRCSRLLYRTLSEFAGPGAEGGKYVCPVGEITTDPITHKLFIQLRPDVRWAKGRVGLTGPDVARLLLLMAEPGSNEYCPEWADLLGKVSSSGLYRVEATLNRAHVRPQGLLQVALAQDPEAKDADQPTPNGPMVLESNGPDETVFTGNRQYFIDAPDRPMEIVERRFATVTQAVQALKRGDIQVLDRINPWMALALRNNSRVTVVPYAMPLVHCLVPNLRRAALRDPSFLQTLDKASDQELSKLLLEDPRFRRALAFGIQRQAILSQFVAGQEIPGCSLTSSPFPLGLGAADPMGYASDETIEARPYELRLAIALASISWQKLLKQRADKVQALKEQAAKEQAAKEQAGKEPDQDQAAKDQAAKDQAEKDANKDQDAKDAKPKKFVKPKLPPIPPLVLAYPPDEIARAACASIQLQLRMVGIEVELRQLEGALPDRVPDDVDLLYMELATWEPVVDAHRLFGGGGIAGATSRYMGLALRELDDAADWGQVRECLRRIHRICYDDVTIIPLWQMLDHFAVHRAGLEGAGGKAVSLYQGVEQWRPTFQYPSEK